MTMWEYRNIKISWKKVTLQIGLKNFLWLKELKIMCWEIRNRINFWKVLQKRIAKGNQGEFRVEKVIKRKGNKL